MADIYAISIENADGTRSYADQDMHITYVECGYDNEAMNIAGHILRGRIVTEIRSLTGRNLPEPEPQAIANQFRVRVELLSPQSNHAAPAQATKLIGFGQVIMGGRVERLPNCPRWIRQQGPDQVKKWRDEIIEKIKPSEKLNMVVWQRPGNGQ